MPKHLHLTIPEPCHEKWQDMSPTSAGRYCGSCEKQVIDFTTMSDQQLREFFTKPSTGSVCGRFSPYQLDREMPLPAKKIPWVKYFFHIAIPAFLFSAKATAQGKVKITGDTVITTRPAMLTGKVAYPITKQPGTLNDAVTKFSLKMKEIKNSPVSIQPQLSPLNNADLLVLEGVMGGLVIEVLPKRKPIPLIAELVDTVKRFFKAYPNPVMSGTNINIEWKGKEEGYFQLNLADYSGRIIHQREIWIDADARVLNFDLPSIPAGNYLLTLANKKSGKVFTEKLVVR